MTRMQGNTVDTSNYFYIDFQVASQDIATNTSSINWQAGWHFGGSPLDRDVSNVQAVLAGVTRYNNAGTAYSYSGNFTVRDQQIASGNFTVNHNSDGTYTLAVSGGATGYSGMRSSGSGNFSLPTIPRQPGAPGTPTFSSITATSATSTWTAPANVGSGLTDVEFQLSTASDFSTTVEDLTNGSWTTTRTSTGLAKGKTHYARVRAKSVAGYGPWSGTGVFSTLTTVPVSPGNPSFANITGTSVKISWSASSDDGGTPITKYSIFWGTDPTFALGVTQTDVPYPGPLTLNLTGLSPGTTYYAKSRATNAVGNSTQSGAGSFTTGIGVPGVPQSLAVGSVTVNSASATWSAPASNGGSAITGYDFQRADDAAFSVNVANSTPSSPYALSGLLPNKTYYVRVRAKNAAGAGAWTSGVSFTTLSGVKIGNGTAWVDAVVYVGNGTQWVLAQIFSGNGTAWK